MALLIVTRESMGNSEMCNILRTANGRAKKLTIWALFFCAIYLGYFSCQISQFGVFLGKLSFKSFKRLLLLLFSTKIYGKKYSRR